MKKPYEVHLMVLWQHARVRESEIIADIQQHLKIMDAYEITWSNDKIAENFTRFYGTFLPNCSHKEKHCGTGPFLCLVLRDDAPNYEMVETSRGHEYVNTNIFSLKQKYREWTGGGHKVHTTNSIKEVEHDSVLLLGLNYEDLIKSLPKKWDGKIKSRNSDLIGAHGFDSLEQFFYTLNATTDYVVLRGFEDLTKTLNSTDHGDIDIMVKDYTAARWIVGGEAHFTKNPRPHYLVNINGKFVYIDLWDINNNYHDRKWDQDIFNTSKVYKKIIHVPNDENYFYMLIYHCLINKHKVASDYYEKIYKLFVKLGFYKKYDILEYSSPFDLYFQLLTDFMNRNKYEFIKPNDSMVYYSDKLVKFGKYKEYLESNFGFTDVQTVYTDAINTAYNLFASGHDANGTCLFIKISEIPQLYANEYKMGEILYNMDSEHFIRPMYYRDCPDGHFVAYKWEQAETLRTMLESGVLSEKDKEKCLDDIYTIFKCLKKSDVVHRDIHWENLVWQKGTLKLIDFQLAVHKSKYRELDFLSKNIAYLRGLGTDKFRQKECEWDDAYSLCKVLECIGKTDANAHKYDKIYNEIKAYIGQDTIKCPRKITRDINLTIFGLPVFKSWLANDHHLKINVFGIRVFKCKIKQ